MEHNHCFKEKAMRDFIMKKTYDTWNKNDIPDTVKLEIRFNQSPKGLGGYKKEEDWRYPDIVFIYRFEKYSFGMSEIINIQEWQHKESECYRYQPPSRQKTREIVIPEDKQYLFDLNEQSDDWKALKANMEYVRDRRISIDEDYESLNINYIHETAVNIDGYENSKGIKIDRPIKKLLDDKYGYDDNDKKDLDISIGKYQIVDQKQFHRRCEPAIKSLNQMHQLIIDNVDNIFAIFDKEKDRQWIFESYFFDGYDDSDDDDRGE